MAISSKCERWIMHGFVNKRGNGRDVIAYGEANGYGERRLYWFCACLFSVFSLLRTSLSLDPPDRLLDSVECNAA